MLAFEPYQAPRTAAATRQRHGSQGRNTTRGIAPAAFLLRSESARSRALASQPRCDIALHSFELCGAQSDTAGVKQSDRRDSERRDSAVAKTVPQRLPSAAAPFRLQAVTLSRCRTDALPASRLTPADAAPSGQPRRGRFSTARSGAPRPTASLRRALSCASTGRHPPPEGQVYFAGQTVPWSGFVTGPSPL